MQEEHGRKRQSRPAKKRIRYSHKISKETISEDQIEDALDLLAKLVARAYMVDHPEKFQPRDDQG